MAIVNEFVSRAQLIKHPLNLKTINQIFNKRLVNSYNIENQN